MPLEIGSVMVSVMAVARAASTALPPARSIRMPDWDASACAVATMLRAKVERRGVGYGFDQSRSGRKGETGMAFLSLPEDIAYAFAACESAWSISQSMSS